LFYGNPTSTRPGPQIIAAEVVAKGFGTKTSKQGVVVNIFRPKERTKAARVAKSHGLAAGQLYVDVVVFRSGLCLVDDTHAAGHAEVQHRGAFVRIEQKVLGASAKGADGLAGQIVFDVVWYRPTQAAIAYDDGLDLHAFHPGREAPAAGFDFRQFRHELLCKKKYETSMKKKPAKAGFFLLDFGFFIKHVFPYRRIVFLGLHLFRMNTLVFGRRVVVSGSGT
jgi:hypothetical protein